jgi:membrane-associated protease RseP (regulator of RpoE activity)
MEIDLYTASVLVFAAFLAVIFWIDRKNVKRESILLLRKTQRGKKFLMWLGTRFPEFWKATGMIGVVAGFFMSFYILYWMLMLTIDSVVSGAAGGLAFVLPSPTVNVVSAPGVIGVPFWYWIITIGLLILVHEGFHGVMAAREKVRIKSLGWGAFILLPLAFVEPDEKQLAQQGAWKQLRVFAAGSFANFVLAFLSLFIFTSLITAAFVPSGVGFRGYTEGFPAMDVNMTGIVTGIDNYTIQTADDLSTVLAGIGPGEPITVYTRLPDGGTSSYDIVTGIEPNATGEPKGYMGIAAIYQDYTLRDEYQPYSPAIYFLAGQSPSFFGLLFFIFLINLGVGAFNLLPLGPLDGGKMWKIALDRIVPKQSKAAMKYLTYALLLMLILNFTIAFL